VRGVDSDPSEADGQEAPELSLRNVLVEMALIVGVCATAGFIFFSVKAGVGVLVGGAMAAVNYYWQKRSLAAIFDQAIGGEKPRFLALRYALRYVVIGGVLLLIYLTGTVSIVAVVMGLASFALAVVIEGLRLILFPGSFKKDV
jgi:hypothetical protein